MEAFTCANRIRGKLNEKYLEKEAKPKFGFKKATEFLRMSTSTLRRHLREGKRGRARPRYQFRIFSMCKAEILRLYPQSLDCGNIIEGKD